MNPFTIFWIVLAIEIPIALAVALARKREGEAARLEALENDRLKEEKQAEGWRVMSILTGTNKALKQAKICAYGPWIAACLDKIRAGEEVPEGVALMALKMTRRDLLGSRFPLDILDGAIAAMETGTGEGE